MFSRISWQEYLLFIGLLCVVYYFVIGIYYYRKELLGFLNKVPVNTKKEIKPTIIPADEQAKLFSRVHELMEELKEVFTGAASHHFIKEELVMALKVTLKEYGALKNTAFKISINYFIHTEAVQKCSISLSDTELDSLWLF